jgi:ATP-citrate lyase beta-subunit
MAQRGIREYDAKNMLARYASNYKDIFIVPKTVLIESGEDLKRLAKLQWSKDKLVVKPDQLFGGRGKAGLVKLGIEYDEAVEFIRKNLGNTLTINDHTGKLTQFLVEPYVEHRIPEDEYFLCIRTGREGDVIHFSNSGGVDIEKNWDNVKSMHIGITEDMDGVNVKKEISDLVPKERLEDFTNFIKSIYRFFVDFGFVYIEINPLTFSGDRFAILDMVARLDDTSAFENSDKWENVKFQEPFGKIPKKEEAYIKSLDEKSGASLKLTILNPDGRLWTMVAGGGASVVYSDTVSDMGFAKELANYGEYSGNPKEDETFEYAKTIIDMLTRKHDPNGKALIIGGGIANFTDVANTFKGIIKAIRMYSDKLREQNVRIYVRRGGPNYKNGLKMMRDLGNELGIPISVHGPEMHMTGVVPMAIKYLRGEDNGK